MINQKDTYKLNSGNSIPVMGLGTWKLNIGTTETVLYAIQKGYRLIDTSSDYRTHDGIGKAIQKTNVPRDNLYLTTKVEETDDAFPATKKYIKEMELEYANLILIHRPPISGAGIDLWKGLIKAKKDGIKGMVEAGGKVILTPGESICLEERMYHRFYGEEGKGKVLVGEVSAVNDDATDNCFYESLGRFPVINEDADPLHLLAADYSEFLKS